MKPLTDSFGYYLLRSLQRLGLLFTVLFTGIYWIVFLIVVVLVEYSTQTVNHEFLNKEAAQHTITLAINTLSWQAGFAGAIAIFMTLLMLLVPHVRKNEKRLVIDGIVIVVFCVLSVMVSQWATQYFIGRFLAG